MRGESISVCRTKSLPACGSKAKKCRKIKPKVSFSALPPSKIEFESEQDPSVTYVDKETLFNARIALFHAEKSGKRYKKDDEFLMTSDEHPESTNDLDSVNEMLLDITEEIEADSVTIEDCLRDAISLKVLDVEDARQIIPNFESKKPLTVPSDFNGNDSTQIEAVVSGQNPTEKPIDKLIDLFSTMRTEDLARCCKFTLGKLCQLTSYEDYENVQRIAASSLSSITRYVPDESGMNIEENSTTSSGFSDDCSVDTSCLSSSSTESMEFSSLESDIDFVSTFCQSKTQVVLAADDKNSIKDAIPSLVEKGILKPRQAWEILGSRNKDEMLRCLAEKISQSCGSSSMKKRMDDIEKVSLMSPFQSRTGIIESSPDLGYCSPQNEQPSPISRKRSFNVRASKNMSRAYANRPFTISSARSKQQEVIQRTSTPHASLENPEECTSLLPWCLENDLHANTAHVLRSNGWNTTNDLLELEAADLQQLSQLSCGTKSRLWLAIEALRLHNYYEECRRKLERCVEAFKLIP